VSFLLALLAQQRPRHSHAVLIGDSGAIHGMDVGAGVLLHTIASAVAASGASTRVTPTAASSAKNTANGGISGAAAHPGGSHDTGLPWAVQ